MRMGVRKTSLLGVAAVAAFALSAGGCSSLPTMPDWVDPTTWFGDDNSNASDNAETPDLASLPDKPAATTPDDQAKVAESLAGDRAHAKYSADALRGGTEAGAAPPPNVAPAPAESETASETIKGGKSAKPAAPPPVVAATQADTSVAQEPAGATAPGTLPETAPGNVVASVPPPSPEAAQPPAPAPEPAAQPAAPPAEQPAAQPAAPPAEQSAAPVAPKPVKHKRVHQAAAAPAPKLTPPTEAPVPPTPTMPQQMAAISPSDEALGFKPSSAPPLDPSVARFVAPTIIARYRQTAAQAHMAYAAPKIVASSKHHIKLHKPRHATAMGGPEHMTGSVVANLDVLGSVSAPLPLPVYANQQGIPATAVVFFPHDVVGLNANARAQIRAAVQEYKSRGGQGYIRVVGHSSSRTPDMSIQRHIEIIFKKSQDRADAVAREIIRDGVPADKVLVDAVGDSQPVYYESMPKGEEGNRRAEIYLQG